MDHLLVVSNNIKSLRRLERLHSSQRPAMYSNFLSKLGLTCLLGQHHPLPRQKQLLLQCREAVKGLPSRKCLHIHALPPPLLPTTALCQDRQEVGHQTATWIVQSPPRSSTHLSNPSCLATIQERTQTMEAQEFLLQQCNKLNSSHLLVLSSSQCQSPEKNPHQLLHSKGAVDVLDWSISISLQCWGRVISVKLCLRRRRRRRNYTPSRF